MAKGLYRPKNLNKYIGNPANIAFRSSWELRVMQFFDNSTSVLKWASEEIKIPYIKPTDGRIHHYYPDFFVVYEDKDKNIKKEILEIKPLKEVRMTEASNNYDKVAILINEAKWKAAVAFAKLHGMEFRIITEASLFKNSAPVKPKLRGTRKTIGTKPTRPTRPTGAQRGK